MDVVSETPLSVTPSLRDSSEIAASIERLRCRGNDVAARVSIAIVDRIVLGVRSGEPLDATATCVGLEPSQVIDIVAALGTWLIHVYKVAIGKDDYDLAVQQHQPTLFRVHQDDILVPLGYEKSATQPRDIARSVAAILKHEPDNAEVQRWVDRNYPTTTGVLTVGDVFSAWRWSQLALLEKIDLVSHSIAFAQICVAAFDLLDVAILDAREGARSIVEIESRLRHRLDLDSLERAVTKLAWANEARVAKTTSLLEGARAGSRELEESLQRDLRLLAAELCATRLWGVKHISSLREGQVLRIVERAGLVPQRDTRSALREVRRALIARGLRKDLDVLLADATSALGAGLEDQFWSAVEARLSGDPQWRSDFQELLADAAKASA